MPQAGQGPGRDDLNCCFLNLLIHLCDVLIASTVIEGCNTISYASLSVACKL